MTYLYRYDDSIKDSDYDEVLQGLDGKDVEVISVFEDDGVECAVVSDKYSEEYLVNADDLCERG